MKINYYKDWTTGPYQEVRVREGTATISSGLLETDAALELAQNLRDVADRLDPRYIDRLTQLEKALEGEARLHRKYWERWHDAIRERDELEQMLSFACKEWGEDIVNLRRKLRHTGEH